MRFSAYIYAFRGISWAFFEERNLRVHLVAGEVVAYLALAEGVPGWVMAILAGLVAFVLALELLNTAIEQAVDLAQPERHPVAAAAKDAAAGAVFVGALGAAVGGLLLLGPGLGSVHPWSSAGQMWGLGALVAAAALTLSWRGRRRRIGRGA